MTIDLRRFLPRGTLLSLTMMALTGCGQGPGDGTSDGQLVGEFETPWGKASLTYQIVDGKALVNGDMLLPLPKSEQVGVTQSALRTAGYIMPAGARSWPGGIVPYITDAALSNDARITAAIEEWEQETRLQFQRLDRVPSAGGYVSFERFFDPANEDRGPCRADVGRRISSPTTVTLHDSCVLRQVVHEIGHAVGLWHEHQRPDRDQYIEVNMAALDPDSDRCPPSAWERMKLFGRSYGPYDTSSIMHYGSVQCIRPGTIERPIMGIDPDTGVANVFIDVNVAGQLSPGDVRAAHKANGLTANQDINGDGFSDLVVGVPGEHVDGVADAGAVQIIFGSSNGTGSADYILSRSNRFYLDVPGTSDRFGSSLAFADFDADGLTDIVVGIPKDDPRGVTNAGAVQVIYGNRLFPTRDEIWTFPGRPRTDDGFGYSIATGDFNGDGYADLAVGAPYANPHGINDGGSVTVRYGSSSGLTDIGRQVWTQNSPGVPSDVAAHERFGFSLATGDFTGDTIEDLAIGVPGETVSGSSAAGAVIMLRGSTTGITSRRSQFLHINRLRLAGLVAQAGDQFGWSLAAGDFRGVGIDDLAIGIPHRTVNEAFAGAVAVVYGAVRAGLNPDFFDVSVLSQGDVTRACWDERCINVGDEPERSDRFGRTLAAGDFDGDLVDDLAVGVQYEDIGASNIAGGSVHVLYARPTRGFDDESDLRRVIHQNIAGVRDVSQSLDYFGATLQVADFNGDTRADLAVGVPGEDVSSVSNAGAVHVFFGDGDRDMTRAQDFITQNSSGVLDRCELNDAFGSGL